ncbi:O-methyltransferase family protein [Fibrella aestuarina BUZ 2]|uniref:O-methyltransferase family protein n=1 Tax=Fibrella aestuarina BUZ 2 TaxID=1166018 RepID=I0KFM3_9BACT|nr:class I SAM-dependent methyltransferase [Fibrella aestuarina]CCH02926.1 O-methyltransferase family protein [Fibrella aestuarina BUZ 2]
MFNDSVHNVPSGFAEIQQASEAMGFSMPSDLQTGALLQTLVAAKPEARVLEIGTGTGLATAWLLAGMDADSSLISIDTAAYYQAVANQVLGSDARLTLVCDDAGTYLERYDAAPFDLIFADAWPGKYSHLDAALGTLATGGLYVIDDMLPQPNWPDGHGDNVDRLVADLESRSDLSLVRLAWSTGILIAVKKERSA